MGEAKSLAVELDSSSRGIIVTDAAWGAFSYVRFHLPSNTSEVVYPAQRKLTQEDTPEGAEWIIASSSDDLSGIESVRLLKRLAKLSLYKVS